MSGCCLGILGKACFQDETTSHGAEESQDLASTDQALGLSEEMERGLFLHCWAYERIDLDEWLGF